MNAVPRFNLAIGQWVELDGVAMRFERRGRDLERRLVFERIDGVPRDMTDREMLELQYGPERRLRLLTAAEASELLEAQGRPRITLDAGDPDLGDETRRRLDYVRGWERAGCPPRTEAAIAHVVLLVHGQRRTAGTKPLEARAPSPRQVLRWVSDWVNSGGDVQGLVPQVANKGNGNDRLQPKARAILEGVVEDRYLLDTRPTAVAVHGHVQVAFQRHNAPLSDDERLPVPSLRAVYRTIARIDSYTLDCARRGRRVADHKWRPVMSGPTTTRHNEIWEIDHTRVDAIVVDEVTGLPVGRPWVTVVIDRHTRCIMGFHIGFDPPGTFPVMECLRVAIMPKDALLAEHPDVVGEWPCMGVGEVLCPDQGREFKGKPVVDGCLQLGMNIEYMPILKAWYKGKVERFFRTLTTDVFQRVPGTTFSNVFERNKEDTPEQVAMTTLAELHLHVLRYVVHVYHRRVHRGLGVSPLEAWNESVRRHGMRPLPDPGRVTAALSHVAWRVPQRYGIEYEGLVYNSPAVAEHRIRAGGVKAVRVSVDPRDLTRIQFLDPDTNRYVEVPILPSKRPLVLGVSLEKHKLARALQRANEARLAGDEGLAQAYTMLDDAMRERGAGRGIENRRDAARYWQSLTRAAPSEEAPAFDQETSGRMVTDGLFGEVGDEPAVMPIPDDAAPVEPEPSPTEEVASEGPVRTRRRTSPRVPATPPDRPPGPADDLDALARAFGMTVTRNDGEA